MVGLQYSILAIPLKISRANTQMLCIPICPSDAQTHRTSDRKFSRQGDNWPTLKDTTIPHSMPGIRRNAEEISVDSRIRWSTLQPSRYSWYYVHLLASGNSSFRLVYPFLSRLVTPKSVSKRNLENHNKIMYPYIHGPTWLSGCIPGILIYIRRNGGNIVSRRWNFGESTNIKSRIYFNGRKVLVALKMGLYKIRTTLSKRVGYWFWLLSDVRVLR